MAVSSRVDARASHPYVPEDDSQEREKCYPWVRNDLFLVSRDAQQIQYVKAENASSPFLFLLGVFMGVSPPLPATSDACPMESGTVSLGQRRREHQVPRHPQPLSH